MHRSLRIVLTFLLCCSLVPAQPKLSPLYRASLVQAAPGKLVDLIAAYQQHFARAGQTPLWMRHSQGDRWDLLILEPMGSYSEYFSAERMASRERQDPGWEQRRKPLVAWEEDVFVTGAAEADVRKAFSGAGFFHVEMFRALAGRQSDLLREREMENAYSKAIGQPENLIFVRDQGASWDSFTIGCFRDLKHYASSADVPAERTQAAAKSAGFESPAAIGPYLRQFIADHHDTLAVAIR
jgi:hypothetical protein